MQEAVASYKQITEEYGGRLYTDHIGPFNTIASEFEYESLAEFEKVIAE